MALKASDGSTFSLPSTSPRSFTVLTKDTRNHHLWNPACSRLDDTSGEISRFTAKYAGLEGLFDELSAGSPESPGSSSAGDKKTPKKSSK